MEPKKRFEDSRDNKQIHKYSGHKREKQHKKEENQVHKSISSAQR